MPLPRILACFAALSLAASSALAQPPQDQSAPPESADDGLSGEVWGYLALPALIVVVLLIAALRGEDEKSISP